MGTMRTVIVLVAVFIVLWWLGDHRGEVMLGPGVMAPDIPLQRDLDNADSFQYEEYQVTPLADFSITAKILSAKNYRFGRDSALSPLDLALGWGPMSDEKILSAFDIDQRSRWYFWRADPLPLSVREVSLHSANMHMIPADDRVEALMDSARVGDIVWFEGWLVDIRADDGWRWSSSLSREDTGNHACELVWVTDFNVMTANVES